jgi:hypothetical protein
VFPFFEELWIKTPSNCLARLHTNGLPTWDFSSYSPLLSKRLEGGLCLFSRMKFLRTLIVGPFSDFMDRSTSVIWTGLYPLDAMSSTPRYARTKRRHGRNGGSRKITWSLLDFKSINKRSSRRPKEGTAALILRPGELGPVSESGLLLAVAVKELDSLDFRPTLSLERLAFNCAISEHPECTM